MALTDENMSTTMLVQPSGGMNYGNMGGGIFGNDGLWLLLVLLLGGGWGGFGGFGIDVFMLCKVLADMPSSANISPNLQLFCAAAFLIRSAISCELYIKTPTLLCANGKIL